MDAMTVLVSQLLQMLENKPLHAEVRLRVDGFDMPLNGYPCDSMSFKYDTELVVIEGTKRK